MLSPSARPFPDAQSTVSEAILMGNLLSTITDGLQSLVSGLGTPRDKAVSASYGLTLLDDATIVAAYRTAWLPRKIVEIPAKDSCRKWRDWQAKADQIQKIEAEEKRLGVQAKILEARIKARLFGGAAVLIGTGDRDPAEPLDPARIGSGGLRYLTVLTRRQLKAGETDTDPMSPTYGRPKYYEVTGQNGTQVQVHPSRLVIFIGQATGDEDIAAGAARGWGDSVLQSVYDTVRNTDATAANIASLVFEAKVDVFKIPNLMGSIGDKAYESRLLQRFALANTAKGINGALLLDGEEEYEQKSASFASLPDVLDRFLQLVAGAADIPVTRLLGTSPAGMNSTGESDLRNFYDRLASEQSLEMGPAMAVLDECLIRSVLGTRPPEVHYIWSSLWQISDKERAEIGVASANTIKTLADTGLFPQEALAKSGANMLVERSILPGFEQAIEDAGGLPDYEAELEAERVAAEARLAAQQDPNAQV